MNPARLVPSATVTSLIDTFGTSATPVTVITTSSKSLRAGAGVPSSVTVNRIVYVPSWPAVGCQLNVRVVELNVAPVGSGPVGAKVALNVSASAGTSGSVALMTKLSADPPSCTLWGPITPKTGAWLSSFTRIVKILAVELRLLTSRAVTEAL